MFPQDPIQSQFGAIEPHRLFTREETARFLKVSVSTLERWARQGIGPRCVKIGPRHVGYPGRELLAVSERGMEQAA
jgi:predicted DNA-binding transcriptional regulator AlpA